MRFRLALFLAACAAPPSPRADAPVMGWIHGEAFAISKAWVFATDNDNRGWRVVLHSDRAFPADFGSDLRAAHVDIAGRSRGVTSIGGDPTQTLFQFETDRAGAEACARGLSIEAKPRVDPRLRLESRLEVPVHRTAPPVVRFTLSNRGAASFSFLAPDPRPSAALGENFEVEIRRDGAPLPPIAPRIDLGGLRPILTLAPGESRGFELALADWTSVLVPGRYEVRVRLHFEVMAAPIGGGNTCDDAHRRWDETAQARCEFQLD